MSDTQLTLSEIDLVNSILNSTSSQVGTSGSTGSGAGNTENRSVNRPSPCKRYCFTWNTQIGSNVPENEWIEAVTKDLYEFLTPISRVFCGSFERGESDGRLHFQGYLELRNKKRWRTLNNLCPRFRVIHWEVARGTRRDNVKYCTKEPIDGTQVICIGVAKPYKFKLNNLYAWQQSVWDILGQEPDDRHIIWIYDAEGNTGKSSFTKHVVSNMKKTAVINGKATDIMNAVLTYIKEEGKYFHAIMTDIPRSSIGDTGIRISYGGLEKIKDMCFYSPKYEGGMVIGPNPHLVVFANCRPDVGKFSIDRIKLYEIVNKELIERAY